MAKKSTAADTFRTEDILQNLYDAMTQLDPCSEDFKNAAKTYNELYSMKAKADAEIVRVNNETINQESIEKLNNRKQELEEKKFDFEVSKRKTDDILNERKFGLEEKRFELELVKMKQENEMNIKRFDLELEKFKHEKEHLQSELDLNRDRLECERKKNKSEARRGWILGLLGVVTSVAATGTMVAMHAKDWENNQRDMMTNPAGKEQSKNTYDAVKRYWQK